MNTFTYKYCFNIAHLISEKAVIANDISFNSPYYPSTEKDKDFLKGQVVLMSDKDNQNFSEIVTEGIELVFSLTNYAYHPLKITKIEAPNNFPSFDLKAEAHSTYPLKNPEEIPALWEKYLKLSRVNKQNLSFAIKWFMRSVKPNEPVDKFIYSWITFNCLYEDISKSTSPSKAIKCLVYNNIPNKTIQNEMVNKHLSIFKYLSSLGLTDKRNNKNWSEGLKKAIENNDLRDTLFNAISTIAIVRHTIFHGNIIDRTIEAERCLWPLTHLNAEIIKHQLSKI
jgi:hypothetical protein